MGVGQMEEGQMEVDPMGEGQIEESQMEEDQMEVDPMGEGYQLEKLKLVWLVLVQAFLS